jgi:hypothetical protein
MEAEYPIRELERIEREGGGFLKPNYSKAYGLEPEEAIKGDTWSRHMDRTAREANEFLRKSGYDGITHMGGQLVGNKPHQVYIAFDPSQIYAPYMAPALQDVPSMTPLLSALLGHNAAVLPERGN